MKNKLTDEQQYVYLSDLSKLLFATLAKFWEERDYKQYETKDLFEVSAKAISSFLYLFIASHLKDEDDNFIHFLDMFYKGTKETLLSVKKIENLIKSSTIN